MKRSTVIPDDSSILLYTLHVEKSLVIYLGSITPEQLFARILA